MIGNANYLGDIGEAAAVCRGRIEPRVPFSRGPPTQVVVVVRYWGGVATCPRPSSPPTFGRQTIRRGVRFTTDISQHRPSSMTELDGITRETALEQPHEDEAY